MLFHFYKNYYYERLCLLFTRFTLGRNPEERIACCELSLCEFGHHLCIWFVVLTHTHVYAHVRNASPVYISITSCLRERKGEKDKKKDKEWGGENSKSQLRDSVTATPQLMRNLFSFIRFPPRILASRLDVTYVTKGGNPLSERSREKTSQSPFHFLIETADFCVDQDSDFESRRCTR